MLQGGGSQDARTSQQPAPPHQAPDLHFYFFLSEFHAGGGNCRHGSPAERGLILPAAAPGVTQPWAQPMGPGLGLSTVPPQPFVSPRTEVTSVGTAVGPHRGGRPLSSQHRRFQPPSPPPGCPKRAGGGDGTHISLGFWGCAGLGEQGVNQAAPPWLEGSVGGKGGQHRCPHGDKGHPRVGDLLLAHGFWDARAPQVAGCAHPHVRAGVCTELGQGCTTCVHVHHQLRVACARRGRANTRAPRAEHAGSS